jgi:hypothetical protein
VRAVVAGLMGCVGFVFRSTVCPNPVLRLPSPEHARLIVPSAQHAGKRCVLRPDDVPALSTTVLNARVLSKLGEVWAVEPLLRPETVPVCVRYGS